MSAEPTVPAGSIEAGTRHLKVGLGRCQESQRLVSLARVAYLNCVIQRAGRRGVTRDRRGDIAVRGKVPCLGGCSRRRSLLKKLHGTPASGVVGECERQQLGVGQQSVTNPLVHREGHLGLAGRGASASPQNQCRHDRAHHGRSLDLHHVPVPPTKVGDAPACRRPIARTLQRRAILGT